MNSDEIKQRTDRALDSLMEQLAAGKSEALMRYLSVMGKFHDYSFGNCMLIACQRPDASHVAGFHKWKELGRFVRKGEKGLMILAPLVGRAKKDAEVLEETAESKPFGFRAVYVWDISQTDGEPLPEFAKVKGDPAHYLDRLNTLLENDGIVVTHDDSIRPAWGMSCGGKIKLAEGLTPASEFSTLAHEAAHEYLHRGADRAKLTKDEKELQAEATAFIISQAIGLDSNTASVDYIKLYHGDKAALLESLEHIRTCSQYILTQIEPTQTPRNAARASVGATIHENVLPSRDPVSQKITDREH